MKKKFLLTLLPLIFIGVFSMVASTEASTSYSPVPNGSIPYMIVRATADGINNPSSITVNKDYKVDFNVRTITRGKLINATDTVYYKIACKDALPYLSPSANSTLTSPTTTKSGSSSSSFSCTYDTPGTYKAGIMVVWGSGGQKQAFFSTNVVVQGSPPICGNSIVETGEQCDDGNTINNDGCSSSCQNEPAPPVKENLTPVISGINKYFKVARNGKLISLPSSVPANWPFQIQFNATNSDSCKINNSVSASNSNGKWTANLTTENAGDGKSYFYIRCANKDKETTQLFSISVIPANVNVGAQVRTNNFTAITDASVNIQYGNNQSKTVTSSELLPHYGYGGFGYISLPTWTVNKVTVNPSSNYTPDNQATGWRLSQTGPLCASASDECWAIIATRLGATKANSLVSSIEATLNDIYEVAFTGGTPSPTVPKPEINSITANFPVLKDGKLVSLPKSNGRYTAPRNWPVRFNVTATNVDSCSVAGKSISLSSANSNGVRTGSNPSYARNSSNRGQNVTLGTSGTSTFTVTCSNSGGSTSKDISVAVMPQTQIGGKAFNSSTNQALYKSPVIIDNSTNLTTNINGMAVVGMTPWKINAIKIAPPTSNYTPSDYRFPYQISSLKCSSDVDRCWSVIATWVGASLTNQEISKFITKDNDQNVQRGGFSKNATKEFISVDSLSVSQPTVTSGDSLSVSWAGKSLPSSCYTAINPTAPVISNWSNTTNVTSGPTTGSVTITAPVVSQTTTFHFGIKCADNAEAKIEPNPENKRSPSLVVSPASTDLPPTPSSLIIEDRWNNPRKTIVKGQKVNISWQGNNISNCSISSNPSVSGLPITVKSDKGTILNLKPTQNTTFTFTCNNGTPNKEISLNVMGRPSVSISGLTTDSDGNPLSGTSIKVGNTVKGTSNSTGNYSISSAGLKGSLVGIASVIPSGYNSVKATNTNPKAPASSYQYQILGLGGCSDPYAGEPSCRDWLDSWWSGSDTQLDTDLINVRVHDLSADNNYNFEFSKKTSPTPPSDPDTDVSVDLKINKQDAPLNNPLAVTIGDSVNLSWTSINATTCNPDWSNSTATSGNQAINVLSGTSWYSIVCSNNNDSAIDFVNIDISTDDDDDDDDDDILNPSITFSASPTYVGVGGSSTLTWSASNTSGCTASENISGVDYWSGPVPNEGNAIIDNINHNITFTLTCQPLDADGSPESATANVQLPYCGNNLIEDGEQCDDGNLTSGDGCNSSCQSENPNDDPNDGPNDDPNDGPNDDPADDDDDSSLTCEASSSLLKNIIYGAEVNMAQFIDCGVGDFTFKITYPNQENSGWINNGVIMPAETGIYTIKVKNANNGLESDNSVNVQINVFFPDVQEVAP